MISKTIDALHKYADVPHTVVFESSRFNAEAVNGGNVAMLPRGRTRFICIYIYTYVCIWKNISKSIRIFIQINTYVYTTYHFPFLFLVYSYKTYLLRSYISIFIYIYIYTFRVFFFIFHQIIFSHKFF